MHREKPERGEGAARAPTLRVADLRVTLGGREIIRRVGFEAGAGELVGLIGPNGSGKTTLLRAFAGLVPSSGTLTLGGRAVARMPRRDLARAVSLMAQHPPTDFTFTAEEVVGLGRLPHLPLLGTAGEHDRDLVRRALARVGAEAFGPRPLRELSGGERRRVMMAQTLAQDAPVMLLDEPTAHLDVSHQYALLSIARELADDGRLVVAALHEIPLAARFCTRLLALQDGRIVADGPPGAVLSPALFADVFGMQAEVRAGPAGPEIRYLQPLPSPDPLPAP
jgi:iron complex transport system ATP-binding protein